MSDPNDRAPVRLAGPHGALRKPVSESHRDRMALPTGRILCRTDQTEVSLSDEAEEYVWATADEALRLPVEPYTETAIRAYLAQQV